MATDRPETSVGIDQNKLVVIRASFLKRVGCAELGENSEDWSSARSSISPCLWPGRKVGP